MEIKIKKHKLHDLCGEQKEQMLIVTNEKGVRMGQASRKECHEGKGKIHLAFMAFVIGPKGNIILTKRSGNKSLWSGSWDGSVVSHVLSGETVEEAAGRRGKEELGIDVKFSDIGAFYYFAKHGKSCENEFCHVLIGKTDKEIYANPLEISEIRKISYVKLKEEIKKDPNQFAPWFLLAFEKTDLGKYL